MHGGATRSGAPKGNQNALKHGAYTKEMLQVRRELAELMRASRQTLREIS
jgi:glucans biosynthesis protein